MTGENGMIASAGSQLPISYQNLLIWYLMLQVPHFKYPIINTDFFKVGIYKKGIQLLPLSKKLVAKNENASQTS